MISGDYEWIFLEFPQHYYCFIFKDILGWTFVYRWFLGEREVAYDKKLDFKN